jgi:hypothetical protein
MLPGLFNQRQFVNQVFGTGVFINENQYIMDIQVDGGFLEGFKPD